MRIIYSTFVVSFLAFFYIQEGLSIDNGNATDGAAKVEDADYERIVSELAKTLGVPKPIIEVILFPLHAAKSLSALLPVLSQIIHFAGDLVQLGLIFGNALILFAEVPLILEALATIMGIVDPFGMLMPSLLVQRQKIMIARTARDVDAYN